MEGGHILLLYTYDTAGLEDKSIYVGWNVTRLCSVSSVNLSNWLYSFKSIPKDETGDHFVE